MSETRIRALLSLASTLRGIAREYEAMAAKYPRRADEYRGKAKQALASADFYHGWALDERDRVDEIEYSEAAE